MTDSNQINKENIVSVVVDRIVQASKKEYFEDCLKSIIFDANSFSGYLGADVINPIGSNRYIVVFRFASQAELDLWTVSQQRNYWVSQIDKVVEKPSEQITVTGLETWFYVSNTENYVPPPKYKMALITYFVIAPLILLFNLIFDKYFSAIIP